MADGFRFKGVTHLENSVNFAASFLEEGQITTLTFDDFVLDLERAKQRRMVMQAVSLRLPVESKLNLAVRLQLEASLSLDAGARAALLIHHGDHSTLVDLPAGPCLETEVRRQLISALPVGLDYRIVLYLRLERELNDSAISGRLAINRLTSILAVAERRGRGQRDC